MQTPREPLSSDSINKIIETDVLIKNIRYHMGLARVKEADGSTRWELKENHMFNKKGIEAMVGFGRSIIDKNQALSNYSEQQIIKVMRDLHKDVARDIAENWEFYDVKNQANANKVVNVLTNNAWSIFNRSRNAKTIELIAGSIEQRSEVKTENEDDTFFGMG